MINIIIRIDSLGKVTETTATTQQWTSGHPNLTTTAAIPFHGRTCSVAWQPKHNRPLGSTQRPWCCAKGFSCSHQVPKCWESDDELQLSCPKECCEDLLWTNDSWMRRIGRWCSTICTWEARSLVPIWAWRRLGVCLQTCIIVIAFWCGTFRTRTATFRTRSALPTELLHVQAHTMSELFVRLWEAIRTCSHL